MLAETHFANSTRKLEEHHELLTFIVGSAIVKMIARYGRDAAPYVGDYVRNMVESLS